MAKGIKTGGRKAGQPNLRTRDGIEACQAHAGKALQTLVDVMDSPQSSDAAKVKAASTVLDRAWGRPAQFVQVVGVEPQAAPPSPMQQLQEMGMDRQRYEEIRQQLYAGMHADDEGGYKPLTDEEWEARCKS